MVQDDQEIVIKFGNEANNTEIISGLKNLAKLYAISIEDLYIKWEQFSMQKVNDVNGVSVRNLDLFKQFLQSEMEKRANTSVNNLSSNSNNNSNQSSTIKRPKNIRALNTGSSLFGFSTPKTPTLNKKRKLGVNDDVSTTSDTSIKLEFHPDELKPATNSNGGNSSMNIKSESNRDSSLPRKAYSPSEIGKIIDSLNPENLEISKGYTILENDKIDADVKIQLCSDPSEFKFRTMRQNLVESSDVLDEQIELFTKTIKKHYNITDGDFGDPSIQSQANIYAVGRIVPDSPQADGFLNPESLSLETSRMNGIGRRIRLNLQNIDEISLFCGQIIALKGKNANGDYFLVDELLDIPYPDSPLSTSEELIEYGESMSNSSTKVIVTSGPYMPDNSFDLTYLSNFVYRINNDIKPHVLIMSGPFIDVTNPMVLNGTIPNLNNIKVQPRTLNELFTKLITPILKKINPLIEVILIPSTRDAISNHASYPQASFDRKSLQLPRNFKCFTNPSTFQVNEAFIGCSNVDIFKDMKEITKGGKTSMRNRFDRISEHILQQRRYYPQFPGAIKKITLQNPNSKDPKGRDSKIYKHISGADLEVDYLGLTEFVGNISPDIIIIPSEMHPFARVVKNVVFINPSKFIKPKGSNGTYIQMSLECPNVYDGRLTEVTGDEKLYLHNIWKRSRIDVITS